METMVGLQPATAPSSVVLARQDLSGLRKAALLLAQMSREQAGAVMKELTPAEIDALTGELLRLKNVDPTDVEDVLVVRRSGGERVRHRHPLERRRAAPTQG